MPTGDNNDAESSADNPGLDLHGAAVIDEHGVEVPITEAMIRSAMRQLDPDAYAPGDAENPHSSDSGNSDGAQ